ncbi:PaaX family transcriptional regulator C-terminal domain-containing protein [Methylobacterium sp. SyP6R]|uniref:PaaX family transcriptional regulator C-terminal domain-containing protein n=1 Tax=Methylobacterium sp. SyP6R TaxID=2718876 RepID=UPI001F2E7A0C|nr:PaaX family transcriptional regulator C-terminal domain-containing protein [Methylobacterium sp. SyP6R]MCF4129950.1 PaaX family transcriptional regulator [Methylobacterium sp. SyP6R]
MSDARGSSADRNGEARGEAPTSRGLIAHLLDRLPLRSGGFIVTLYGDVVEPRGGRLWMGNIVEIGRMVGISETLVRTAVSRLVAAGQLTGERQGRRSFYRLTEAARREFLSAARTLFAPQSEPGWLFVWLGLDQAGEAGPSLERAGFVRLGPHWLLGPARHRPADPALVVFEAGTAPSPRLADLVAAHWDLAVFAAAYDAFLAAFTGIADALDAGARPTDEEALQLRLLLVHAYRHAALRDARLPAATLPPDWSGHRARRLFADLYLRLSPAADRHVGHHFLAGDERLPAQTAETVGRTASLSRIRDEA